MFTEEHKDHQMQVSQNLLDCPNTIPPHIPELVPFDFHLLEPMKAGLRRQHFPDVTVNTAVKRELPLLVQSFSSKACRLLFVAGENA
jgi:hypothetical protein